MIRGSAFVFLCRMYQKLIGMLIGILLVRLTGTTGNGVYALLILVSTYVTTLGSLGLGPAHVHFRGQRRMEVSEVLGNAVLGSIIFGAASIALFSLLRIFVPLDVSTPLPMTIITLTFPIVIAQSYLDYLWIGENRMGTYSAMYALRYVTLPALLLLGVLLPSTADARYAGMALAILANTVLTLLSSLWVIGREFGLGARLDSKVFSRTVRYGVHVQAGSVAQAIGYRFDAFLIKAFMSASPLGVYMVATTWAEAIWLLPNTISTALMPRASTRDADQAKRITERTARVVFTASLLAGVVLYAGAGLLLSVVYGIRSADGVTALRVLLIGTVVFSLQKVLANYFIGQGKAVWFERATIVAMAVNVAINLWLIPMPGWGIKGAAVASAISYSLSTVILAALFVRWTGCNLLDILLIKKSDILVLRSRWGQLQRHIGPVGQGRSVQ